MDSQINDSEVSATPTMYQSASGENLTKSQTGGKGIVKTCTTMRKGMELNKNIGRKEPPPLRSEVARAIR